MKSSTLFARVVIASITWSALQMAFCPTLRADSRCKISSAASVKLKPPSVPAYQQLGSLYEQNGQIHCAVEIYQQGATAFPESSRLQLLLGTALQSAGLSGEAALRRAVDLDPASEPAHMALGVLEHDRGNQAEALRQWQEVARLNPGAVLALDWIAKTRIEAQQYTAAADLLATAPDNEDLTIDRLVATSRSGLYEQAIAVSEKSVEQHADWLRLRMAVATVLLQRNRYEEAISLLQREVQSKPDGLDLQVLYLRAVVLSGDLARGRAYAAEFLQKYPGNFDGLYLNGLLARQAGNYGAALAHLKAAAALQPGHFDVLFNLGATLAKLHRPEEAAAQLERALALDDSGPDIHFQLAGVLRSLNRPDDAKQQMDLYKEKLSSRALRDQTISLSAQAAQKLTAGDAAGAIEVEKDILKILPNDAVPYYNLSLAQDLVGDFTGEQAALEHAVALRPGFALAYNQLGYLAMKRGDSAVAEEYFRKAIASAPQYAEAESNLGSLLATKGKDVEAETYFRSAVAANPRYTDAWINLAASLAARSMFVDARQAIQSALFIDPANADAAQLLALLPPAMRINQR